MEKQENIDVNKKVYISGPIAHHDLKERMTEFSKYEKVLTELGFFPVNPFKNGISQDADWREHMKADISLLLGCNFIFMMPGWELSKGCKLELDVATSCGVKLLGSI